MIIHPINYGVMENIVFMITHLIMAVCCLVILRPALGYSRKKERKIEKEKKSVVLPDEVIKPKEAIIDGNLQLTTN